MHGRLNVKFVLDVVFIFPHSLLGIVKFHNKIWMLL